jgi:hypothetical protein
MSRYNYNNGFDAIGYLSMMSGGRKNNAAKFNYFEEANRTQCDEHHSRHGCGCKTAKQVHNCRMHVCCQIHNENTCPMNGNDSDFFGNCYPSHNHMRPSIPSVSLFSVSETVKVDNTKVKELEKKLEQEKEEKRKIEEKAQLDIARAVSIQQKLLEDKTREYQQQQQSAVEKIQRENENLLAKTKNEFQQMMRETIREAIAQTNQKAEMEKQELIAQFRKLDVRHHHPIKQVKTCVNDDCEMNNEEFDNGVNFCPKCGTKVV